MVRNALLRERQLYGVAPFGQVKYTWEANHQGHGSFYSFFDDSWLSWGLNLYRRYPNNPARSEPVRIPSLA